MKRNLQPYDNEIQTSNKRKKTITSSFNLQLQEAIGEEHHFFQTLKHHETVLKNHFENRDLPNEVLVSINSIKHCFFDFQNKFEETKKQKDETSLALTRLTQNNFQFLDFYCLKKIFNFLPNDKEHPKKQLLDCICFTRTCKKIYNTSKEINFQTTILNKQISLPFPVYQHILQIPKEIYTATNQDVMIHCAEQQLSNIIIPTLNKFGFDINKTNSEGYSPLMHLFARKEFEIYPKGYPSNVKLVQLLVSYGADIHQKSEIQGRNCLHLNSKTSWGSTLETLKYLISIGGDINALDDSGYNCLMLASKSGNLKIVKYLISVGFDPNVTNNDGENCLFLATYFTKLEVLKYLLSIDVDPNSKKNSLVVAIHYCNLKVVKYLISTGMDPNVKNDNGDSGLLVATTWGHVEMIKYLVSLPNIDLNLENNNNETALDIAKKRGQQEIIDLLIG